MNFDVSRLINNLLPPGAAEPKWQRWRGGEWLQNSGPWDRQSVRDLGDRPAHRRQVNIHSVSAVVFMFTLCLSLEFIFIIKFFSLAEYLEATVSSETTAEEHEERKHNAHKVCSWSTMIFLKNSCGLLWKIRLTHYLSTQITQLFCTGSYIASYYWPPVARK